MNRDTIVKPGDASGRKGRRGSLHSRYNPRLEAERYVAALSLNGAARFFILIEPGLGYLIGPLRKRAGNAKIVALHASALNALRETMSPEDSSGCDTADAEWYPESGIPVRDFLEKEIPDSGAAEIQILEWRPALAVYHEAYLNLVEEAAEFIKRADANARTLKAFGRSWFRNFFRNLEIIRSVLCPLQIPLPLLVTGAGPGLEDVIPRIQEERGALFILAVSSSASALEANGLVPDMLIATDGGLWARYHLYDSCRGAQRARKSGALPCPLAAAMTASLPSQCASLPFLPLCDGSLWQTLILRELNIPFIVTPQRGTVSAAALDLAFVLSEREIGIAGIDLANRDLRSHARPYSLDRFLEEKDRRVNPFYSQTYRRSSMLKAGGSYGIYASWFEKQLAAYPKRLCSLGKNNPLFSSLESVSFGTGQSDGAQVQYKIMTLEHRGSPSQRALVILEKALCNPYLSAKLEEELGALFFSGRAVPPPQGELIEELYTLGTISQDG